MTSFVDLLTLFNNYFEYPLGAGGLGRWIEVTQTLIDLNIIVLNIRISVCIFEYAYAAYA